MSKDGLRKFVFLFWPTSSLAVFSILGFTFEWTMIRTRSGDSSLLFSQFPVLSTFVLAGYWLAIAWLLHSVFLVRHSLWRFGSKPLAVAGRTLLSAIVFSLLFALSASWLAYWRSGYFLSVNTFEFTRNSLEKYGKYLDTLQTRDTMIALASLIALLVGTAWLMIAWRNERQSTATRPTFQRWLRPIALALIFGATIISAQEMYQDTQSDSASGLASVALKSHPFLAMADSVCDLWSEDHVDPTLAMNELVEIRKERFAQIDSEQIQKKSIIFIAVESLNHDAVNLKIGGRDVMPNVRGLAARSVVFTRAYSQGTHSSNTQVSIDSSLLPYQSASPTSFTKDDPWPKTLIYDLLKPAGYATAHFSMQNSTWGGVYDFLNSPNLDLFYDPERNDGSSLVLDDDEATKVAFETGRLRADKSAEDIVAKASEWIRQQKRAKKTFYLSLNFPVVINNNTVAENSNDLVQPDLVDGNIACVVGPQTPLAAIRNAHQSALHSVDEQIGKLVDCLKELAILDDVVLVVYGENGESVSEGASTLHASDPTESVVRVACMIHAPNLLAPTIDEYPFQLTDVTPSVLGLLGWEPHPNFQGENVFSADRSSAEEKLVFLHVNTPLSYCDAVISGGKYKLVYFPKTDKSVLTNVDSDPAGNVDLSKKMPELAGKLKATLQQWRQKQLAYYRYPFYYENYYPPKPPKLPGQELPASVTMP